MKKVVLSIDGMTCSACSNGLEKYLNKQNGIKSATVNLVMANALIEYDENILNLETLEKFVEEAGFKSLGIYNENSEKKQNKNEKVKFIIFSVLAVALMYISMGHMIGLPNFSFLDMHMHPLIYAGTLLALTIAFVVYGFDIIKSGCKNLIHKAPNMDTLVAMGVITSILYKADPEEVKLLLIDPKVVELSVYNGIPHLLTPVVTDPKKASGALNWAVDEMTKRYKLFAKMAVRDLKGYNAKVSKIQVGEGETPPEKMPQIVIIIDELADLMMVAPGEVEDAIVRLSQLARAAGIHLVIATQRPSVNVITGLIKANVPSRIAFSVSSGVDSRTIIDMNGAEKLLGKGDMLFYPSGYPKPVRVQGSFV